MTWSWSDALALFGSVLMTLGAFMIHIGLGFFAVGVWCIVFAYLEVVS